MIAGRKIYLCEITSEHTGLIVRWRNNPNVRSKFIFREKFTNQMHENWLETKVATGEVVQFVIYTNEKDIPIGSVYLRDIDYHNKKAEYGIFIGEDEARGHGYGTEAANLMCQYAFEQLKLHKLMLRVFADNKNAIRSYEKAGFVQEAYLKDEELLDGKYKDVIFMARINEK